MSATLTKTALACQGGAKTVTEPPPAWPVVGSEERAWMDQVVQSGAWSWLGTHEMAFSREFAEFIGVEHCICLANGTVTLQCALQAVGVEPGDEVIVPGLTWVATAQAALDIGANVVLVDIDPETLCLDPAAVRAAITPRTRAIVPVHLYGCMCDMDAIGAIAREHGLKVVEDVAHQHGSAWRGVRAGALGDAGSFSFQQSKILTSGEGGAVTCRDRALYQTVFALKQVGWMPDPEAPLDGGAPQLVPGGRYAHNYRITEMQCVLLRGGLKRLAEQNARREQNAQRFAQGLAARGGPLAAAPRDPRVTTQAYYALTLHFAAARADGVTREQYRQALAAEGLPLSTVYPPVYRSPLMNLYDRTSPVPFREAGTVQNYCDLRLPGVEAAVAESALVLSHTLLLAGDAYVEQMLAAVDKVNAQLDAVRALPLNQ